MALTFGTVSSSPIVGILIKAAILYGSQMVEAPTQEVPLITVSVSGKNFDLKAGAYSARYSTGVEAERAADFFQRVIEHVQQSALTAEFYAARDDAKDALERVAKLLIVGESVNREIDQKSCIECEAMVGFGKGEGVSGAHVS